MNWIKYIAMLSVAIAVSNGSSAQLLKKLKEKAERSLEGKKKNNNVDDNASSASSSSGSSSSSSRPNSKEATSPPTNGTVVFSLDSDEQLLYDETSIIASNNNVSYRFVIKNSKYEYFVIDNGTRTGPFKNPPIKSSKTDTDESGNSDNDVSMGDKKDEVAIQYTKTIGGKLHIVFNGKNYGPYDHVSKMVVSPDKKQFFAIVTIGGTNNMTTKMGMGNTFMVSSTGLKQKAGSGNTIPMKFYVSEGFTQAMVVVMDQSNQKIFTVTSTGKQLEGSMADMYSGGENKIMVSDKGDIISIPSGSPRQILVNGNEAASFKVPIESINRLFITPDVSRSVYYDKGKLYKADGTEVSLSGIVFPKVVTIGNVTSVYYFKVFKNESGVKDVYLCKKEI